MTFEVLIAVMLKIKIFWDIKECGIKIAPS